MWGSRGDSRLGDWSDFVFKSKSSDVCLLKYPVETAAEFQLCWYLARLKQSNVQRDTLQEQWHTRSTPAPVDIWTVQRVAQTWPACPRHSKQNGNVWRCNSSKAIHHLVTSRGKSSEGALKRRGSSQSVWDHMSGKVCAVHWWSSWPRSVLLHNASERNSLESRAN